MQEFTKPTNSEENVKDTESTSHSLSSEELKKVVSNLENKIEGLTTHLHNLTAAVDRLGNFTFQGLSRVESKVNYLAEIKPPMPPSQFQGPAFHPIHPTQDPSIPFIYNPGFQGRPFEPRESNYLNKSTFHPYSSYLRARTFIIKSDCLVILGDKGDIYSGHIAINRVGVVIPFRLLRYTPNGNELNFRIKHGGVDFEVNILFPFKRLFYGTPTPESESKGVFNLERIKSEDLVKLYTEGVNDPTLPFIQFKPQERGIFCLDFNYRLPTTDVSFEGSKERLFQWLLDQEYKNFPN